MIRTILEVSLSGAVGVNQAVRNTSPTITLVMLMVMILFLLRDALLILIWLLSELVDVMELFVEEVVMALAGIIAMLVRVRETWRLPIHRALSPLSVALVS